MTGAQAAGNLTESLTGLTVNTPYFIRARATNSVGTVWSANAHTFTTNAVVGPPVVATADATAIATTGATINGNLLSFDGNPSSEKPTVTLYYGDNDGGETTTSWDSNVALAGTHSTWVLLPKPSPV